MNGSLARFSRGWASILAVAAACSGPHVDTVAVPARAPDLPTITLTSPLAVASASYVATGTLAPGAAGGNVVSATLAVNDGASMALDVTASVSQPLALGLGLNSLEFTVVDDAGRVGNSAYIVDFEDGSPTSADLIAADEAAGTITMNAGLVARVQALAGDPDLPAQYGANRAGVDEGIFERVRAALPTMSPAEQDIVGPFLAPPFYAGSGFDRLLSGLARAALPCNPILIRDCPLSLSWKSIANDNGAFRIWYRAADEVTDLPTARHLLQLLETDGKAKIITDYMGREPKSDGGGRFNGGDDKIDFVLTPLGGPLGLAQGNSFSTPMSGFVLIDRSQPRAILDLIALHELTHLVEFNFDLKDGLDGYATSMEATAEFCTLLALPDSSVHYRDPDFTTSIHKGLFQHVPGAPVGPFEYSTYLFLDWLYHKHEPGVPDTIVRDIWNAAKDLGEFDAYVHAITAHRAVMEDVWLHFAIDLWNAGPDHPLRATTGSRYAAIAYEYEDNWGYASGNYYDQRVAPNDLQLNGHRSDVVQVPIAAPNFSVRYGYYSFSDPEDRTLLLLDGIRSRIGSLGPLTTATGTPLSTIGLLPRDLSIRGARVGTILRHDGTWQAPRAWTPDDKFQTYCQQIPSAKIDQLVVIETLADPMFKLGPQPGPADEARIELDYSHAMCGPADGQATFSLPQNVSEFLCGYADKMWSDPAWTYTATAHWEPYDLNYAVDDSGGTAIYGPLLRLTGGGWTLEASGTNACTSPCSWSAGVSAPFEISVGAHFDVPVDTIRVMPWLEDYVEPVEFGGFVDYSPALNTPATCNSDAEQVPGSLALIDFFQQDSMSLPDTTWSLGSDGLGLTGDASLLWDNYSPFPYWSGAWSIRSAP